MTQLDTEAELTLTTEESPPTVEQTAVSAHQAKAARAVEPLGPSEQPCFAKIGARCAAAQRSNTIHIQNFKSGEEFDVMAPCLRRAAVEKVAGTSCIVKCKVWQNVPVRNDKGYPIDNWVPVTWREVWALRSLQFQKDDNPRIKWTEKHVVVMEDSRPEESRARSQSGVLHSYVRLVPAEGEDKPPEGGTVSNIKMPEFENWTKTALLAFLEERDVRNVNAASRKSELVEAAKGTW